MSKVSLRTHALVGGLLVALSVLAYLPVLNLTFLADDWAVIRLVTARPGTATDWSLVFSDLYTPLFDRSPKYRPFYSLSFAMDYSLYGTWPTGYRLTNLALHAASSILVYLLAMELVSGEGRRGIAATAGALFAVYPVHLESVTWIAGRVDLICSVFFLATLILYLRWLRSDRSLYYALSLAAFALALLSKEMAVTVPGLLFLGAVYRGSGLRRAVASVVPFAALLAGFLAFRAYLLSGLSPNATAGRGLEPLASLAGSVYRTLHMLVPVNFTVLPAGVRGFAEPALLAAAAGLVGLAAFLCYRRRDWGLPLLLVGLYATSLVPVLKSLRPDPNLIHSRWSYIPSVFLAILIAYVLWRTLAGRSRLQFAASAAVCLLFLAAITANHGPWLRAGELTERYLERGEKPELPVQYKGAHVFSSEITWISANSPPFEEQ